MNKRSILSEVKEIDMLIIRKTMQEAKNNNIPTITPIQCRIIEYLIQHQGEQILQRDLEKFLKLRRSTISGVLQTMEKNKIIEKKNVKEDARSKEIIFSPVAQEKHEKIKEKLNKFEKIIRKDISDNDLNIFFKVTEQIKNNLQGGNN